MMSNDITSVSNAFEQGKIDCEKWLANLSQTNQPVQVPRWPTHPSTKEEHYYRKGFEERFTEMTKISTNQAARLSKKNYNLNVHKNGKARPNALDREIKSKGADFLSKYGDRFYVEIKNLSERILRDLSNANINVPDYEEYFKSNQLLDSLISVATAKSNYHTFVANAIHFYGICAEQSAQGLTPDNYTSEHQRFFVYHSSNAQIYTTLANALVEFKSFLLSGIFNPESIHAAESYIYSKKLNMSARDPYAQRRL